MRPDETNPTEIAHAAVCRVAQPIRPERPKGGRFFVSPPILCLATLLMTGVGFLAMAARVHNHFGGGF